MKATGEVMAIDRTFGSALNKALRGLEQAGAGPLAEDPSGRRRSTTSARSTAVGADRRTPTRTSTTQPIRWIDEDGKACESTRLAQRSAAPIVLRRFLAPSDSRLWRLLGLLRRGVPEATIQEATGIAPWFLAEMGRNVALEAEVRAIRARLADPTRRRTARRRSSSRRRSGRASATGSSRRSPASPRQDLRAAPRRARPPARLRDGRHLRRRVRGRDAVLLLDVRRRRLGARGAAGRPPGGARHRQRPGPDRAGDRVRLLRRPGRRHAPRARLAGGDDQLEPGDRLDRLRRELAAVLRAARRRRASGASIEAETRPGEALAPRGRRVRRPDAAQPRGAARRRPASRSSAATSRRSTRPRSGRASPRSSTGSASPSPRAAWPTASRRR